MNTRIVCRTCQREIVAWLSDGKKAKKGEKLKTRYITGCTGCEKKSLASHFSARRSFGLSDVPWEPLKKWQDEMIADFERQMKGLSPLKLLDPGDPRIVPLRGVNIEEDDGA